MPLMASHSFSFLAERLVFSTFDIIYRSVLFGTTISVLVLAEQSCFQHFAVIDRSISILIGTSTAEFIIIRITRKLD